MEQTYKLTFKIVKRKDIYSFLEARFRDGYQMKVDIKTETNAKLRKAENSYEYRQYCKCTVLHKEILNKIKNLSKKEKQSYKPTLDLIFKERCYWWNLAKARVGFVGKRHNYKGTNSNKKWVQKNKTGIDSLCRQKMVAINQTSFDKQEKLMLALKIKNIRIPHPYERDFNTFYFQRDNKSIVINKDKKEVRVGAGKKSFWLPIKFTKPLDEERYNHMCQNCKIVETSVKRRLGSNLKYEYYMVLTVKGEKLLSPKLNKIDKKHCLQARVGLDLGVSTLAVVNQYGDQKLFDLDFGIEKYENQIKELERELDRLRRLHNPDNYKEDGTIKKGKRGKKHWHYSNRMIKMQKRRKYLFQVMTETKRFYQRKLSNIIMGYGTDFYVEGNNVEEWKRRTDEAWKKNGRKKKFGLSVQRFSPASMISNIEQKCIDLERGFQKVDEYELKSSQYNHVTREYRKKDLSERSFIVGGNLVHRDLYSGYLLANLIKKGTKNTSFMYDDENIEYNFDLFLEQHEKEKVRLKNNNSTFDFNKMELILLESME